ncbi:MAG: ester cyclase [Chloroflexota bacterium]
MSGISEVDGKDLVRRYLEDVFSGGNVAAMNRYLRGDEFMEGVAELVTRWRTAFPDFRISVEEVIVEGDRVVSVEILSGTHDGVYQSRIGPIAPTGTKVSWSRISIRRLDGARFVDGFFEEDEVGLLTQLGALTDPGQVSKGRHSPMAPGRRPSVPAKDS